MSKDKDITDSKAIQILTKPIEQDVVATGNDSHLYRSVEKALGEDVTTLARKYSATVSKRVIGEVSADFVREVEQKALDLGRAYVIRRILSKRKQLMDKAFDRAMNDPKGQTVLLRLLEILLGETRNSTKTTKKIVEERKIRFEDIADKPPVNS